MTRYYRHISRQVALLPGWFILIGAYLATIVWTVRMSFTTSRSIPVNDFAGLSQYRRLFSSSRWTQSLENMVVYGGIFIIGCLVIGFLLAVLLDQKVKGEGLFRTIFLYPYAVSFVVTGLVWQWVLNPTLGLQKAVQDLGFSSFTFDWLVDRDRAIYVLAGAAIWQASGLVMALMLAGLRGVDGDLWKAARVDGASASRYYLRVVLPLIRPSIVSSTVLLSVAVIKSYDLVVAMTGGGPGNATELPAKFIMDYLFGRSNLGLATAASVVLLATMIAALAPVLYVQSHRARKAKS
ncbi:sugar ABC transporter permease [Thioclava sp. GXIMD2076]|uniref:Sugar ABC transporter permease n=1 Tax=Thioclava kandeliae TaxID=3070818 RepID=A0ABV1SLX6_9RHOB